MKEPQLVALDCTPEVRYPHNLSMEWVRASLVGLIQVDAVSTHVLGCVAGHVSLSEELLGRSIDEVFEPVDADRARSLGERGRRGELSRYRVHARRRTPRAMTVDVTTTLVRHGDGRPLPAVIVVEPRT